MAGDKILVFGATGPSGIVLLRELLFRKHPTIAYVRTPSKIPADLAADPLLEIVKGDVNDEEALSSAVAKSRMVVSLLGPGTREPNPQLYAEFYARLFAIMRRHGVRRIMASSTASADDPQDRFSLSLTILVLLVRIFAPGAYRAMRGIAGAFRAEASGGGDGGEGALDWTVFRIPFLPGNPDAESWRRGRDLGAAHVGYPGDGTLGVSLNRSVLARWLVDSVENEEEARRWFGKFPAISGPVSKKKTA